MTGIEVTVSDRAELASLRQWLAAVPDTRVTVESEPPGAGEQGAVDYLSVVASSSALIAAIRVLPEFLRARRSNVSVTVTRKGKPVTVKLENVDDAMAVLERLLDE